jgi:hypothetical protein
VGNLSNRDAPNQIDVVPDSDIHAVLSAFRVVLKGCSLKFRPANGLNGSAEFLGAVVGDANLETWAIERVHKDCEHTAQDTFQPRVGNSA